MNNTLNLNYYEEPSCCVKEAQQEELRKYNEILQLDDFNASQYRNASKKSKAGDVNQDGKVDAKDAEIVQTLIDEGITTVEEALAYFDEHHLDYNAKVADINNDGIIDSNDKDASIGMRTATFTITIPDTLTFPINTMTIDGNAAALETYPIWTVTGTNTGTIEFASDKDLSKKHTFKVGDSFTKEVLLSPEVDNSIDMTDYFPALTWIVDITEDYDTSSLPPFVVIEKID